VGTDEGFAQIVNRACLTSASNTSPSCAEMRFLRAAEIPATGETPWWRSLLAAGAAGLSALVVVWRWRFTQRCRQSEVETRR
jgi:hypothetical protein